MRKQETTQAENLKIEALQDIVDTSEHIVFLGGAGVSTESGIPDFRGKDGLYRKRDRKYAKYKPEYLLSIGCLEKKPELFFAYFRENLDARNVQANAAHLALAKMEQAGRLDGVITQNIDGLHQKAGSKNVQEIHGSAMRSYCVSCKAKYDANFIFDSKDEVPRCPVCGAMVRPDVTLYGEFLPSVPYDNSIRLITNADCLIIGGTSLEVGSAAGLAQMFLNHKHGSRMVIINRDKTKMDGKADLVLHDSIGTVLGQLT